MPDESHIFVDIFFDILQIFPFLLYNKITGLVVIIKRLLFVTHTSAHPMGLAQYRSRIGGWFGVPIPPLATGGDQFRLCVPIC